jgi:Putative prokaryotic signal transducing protein
MEELLRTNDIVLISFVEALLRDAGITAMVMDQNMSVIEGSLGVLPRRIMVRADEIDEARGVLKDAGIGGELENPKKG